MPTAYEGKQPYIFVSYSHADKTEVLRYIDALEKQGFRVWFDGGIEAGSEWPEFIANRLAESACVLAFISQNFVESINCRQELAFSQELKKEQLNVYLEKVELSMGMRMQLGLNQAMWRENFKTEQSFVEELCKARLLASCRAKQTTPPPAPAPAPQKVSPPPAPAPAPAPAPSEVQSRLVRGCKRLGWIGSLLELLYIPISIEVLEIVTLLDVSGFWLFVNMLFPHTIIAVINKILFSSHLKKMKKAGMKNDALNDAAMVVFMVLLFSTLVSVVACAFTMFTMHSFFVQLLIALGVNIVPLLIAGLITLFLAD